MKPFLKIVLFIFLMLPYFSRAQSAGDYRSAATGNWNVVTTWETYNGAAWVAASATPNNTDGVITIRSPHNVSIPGALTIDQTVIDVGGTVQTTSGIVLTIFNGTGVDLTVNGTFIDGSSSSISWNASSTWLMGATGTLVKTTGNAAATWQTNYSGGISTIPSTGNWILRKTTAANPVITTIGAYYPNLIIENNYTSAWTTVTTSTFQGNTGFPTIKGNFDIGGTGTNTVNFLNQHTFGTPSLVIGNTIIRSGNTLSNYGTGLEMQGDLTVSGTIQYDASDARKLIFSGAIAQSVSGAGTLNVYDMTMNKSANALTLNRAVTVDNLLTFTSGIIYSSSTNLLTINTSGSVTGASNTSFVDGPVRYVGSAAFTYPVGKGSDYQALGISATSGGAFWTEDFGTGCSTGTLASSYSGTNGAWSVVSTGSNGSEGNVWYVSAEENGNAVGNCGSGCGTDRTLHVSSNPTWAGDLGAAYEIGCVPGCFSCDFFGICAYSAANLRAQSPTINCTGYSSITIAFNYLEYGDGSNDNATLWYYDGTTWSQIADMAKTSCVACGGACNTGSFQGVWTAYSTTLPVSANNNANVKIGFNWTNNDDAVGWDPSFAVDDITLSAPSTIDFTSEYFYADPQTTFNNVLVPSLNHISQCEYWILTRNAGSASKNVTLTWDANSCGVTLLSDLRVARWDGAVWQNEGNTATTGTTAAGTVTSSTVSNFSPFTLASVTTQNPLPIELVDFDARYNGLNVDVLWTTQTEINNDFFAVERTVDGNKFMEIARVQGAGNSSQAINYSAKDYEPMEGISYYRLKQTDFDGKFSYSNLAAIEIKTNSSLEILNIFSNEDNLDITIACSCKSFLGIEIMDMTGKIIYTEKISSPSVNTFAKINSSKFSKGIYLLKATDGIKTDVRRFTLN